MWSSERRTLLAALAATATLAACGFTPAYAPGGSGERLRGQIRAAEPKTAEAFSFVAYFEDRIGRTTEAAPYLLKYSIGTRTEGLAVTPDQETLRYNLIGELTFQVIDQASGEQLTSGRLESFTAYSAIGSTVSTRASENNAEERLMAIFADQLVAQLLATGGTWLP